MGLDMYFEAVKHEYKSYASYSIEDGKADETNYPEGLEVLADYIYKRNFKSMTVKTSYQIGYFRKFNALHNYIVQHYTDGEDNCREVYLEKENIIEMKDICEGISKAYLEMIAAKKYSDEAKELELSDAEQVAAERNFEDLNTALLNLAETLLPTAAGFFFGSTMYDEWYFSDVLDAADLFKLILDTVDFEKWHISYQASW